MYYIWSFVISIIIFSILQYFEKEKEGDRYILFKIHNIILFFMIYLISTILCYFIFSSDVKSSLIIGGDNNIFNEIKNNTQIDPSVLKKIPDNFNIGFEPFSMEE